MLIWEFAQADPQEVRRIGERLPGSELFMLDGARDVLAVAQTPHPQGGAPTREVSVVFDGGRAGAGAGDWLFFVGLWTPEDFRDEFLGWYKFEHLPVLLECPAWDGCRFVEEKVGKGCQFYAMHQLSDRAALDSVERQRSRATPWFRRLAQQPWFDGGFTRKLYRRVPTLAQRS